MGLPFLEVAHLASSSSFYSAALQPLGLRYLSTDDGPFPSIFYGDRIDRRPLFELRQIRVSRGRPLKPSYIVLSAPSVDAADDAYECALRATPESREGHRDPYQQDCSVTRKITPGGDTRVHIVDFDGNSMEIIYRPPPEYEPYYGGSTVRQTQSTPKEASRILDWSYGIAVTEMSGPKSSGSSRSAGRRPYSGHPSDEPYSSLKRSITDGPLVHEPLPSPRQNSTGLSAGTVVGTLLGVAAAGAALGSAITYSKVKADRSRQPRQEFDAPGFSRRSTFPAPDPYADRKSRYSDAERTVEKVRYPDDYAPPADYRPAPDYIARYSQAGVPRSREVEDVEDRRSRYSASRSRASTRHRSEGPSNRAPLLIEEAEHRSQASSSRSSRHPPIVQRSYTYDAPERDSFVSARSHRSSTTIRGPPQPGQSVPLVSRSKSGSRYTTSTVRAGGSPDGRDEWAGTYVSARGVPLPPSTYMGARGVPLPPSTYVGAGGVPLPPSTYVHAREVPLPRSKSGRSRGGWDDEDDNDSVAPSDSISCVGSRRSGRAYR